jgi:anthraniloyl-CoA monooxygenase
MKILVAGGGPAGLSTAALLARASKANKVTLIERRQRSDSHGWGVTLRNQALSFLELGRLLEPQWLAGRRFLVRGECRVDYPNPPEVCLATLARDDLVAALAARCEDSGVAFHYGVDATRMPAAQIEEFDVVVAADGAHSRLRERWASAFEPTVTHGENWYAWLATDCAFPKLTIVLSDRNVPLLAWAYQYAPGLSSFIIERQDLAPEHAEVLHSPVSKQCRALAHSFQPELRGHSLFCAEATHWARFPLVRCKRLHAGQVVLVGDAAHTTHFSQGFGTMFAFDDACALNEALQGATSVAAGLEAYERAQTPRIAQFQAAADASRQWSEQLLAALNAKQERQVQVLVAARWPVNNAPPAPAPRHSFAHPQYA